MGDYASGSVTFYAVPPAVAAKVVKFIDNEGLGVEWSEPAPSDRVLLDVSYTRDELSLSFPDDVLSFAERHGLTVEVYQSPKYEFPGVVGYFAPSLGAFSINAEDSGVTYLEESKILELIDEPDQTIPALRDKVHKAFGKDWRDAIAATPDDEFVMIPEEEEED